MFLEDVCISLHDSSQNVHNVFGRVLAVVLLFHIRISHCFFLY